MDFIDEVRTRSGRFEKRIEHLMTEEATKSSLVMPFLQMLGYDIFDPTEVVPEFTADFGNRKGEKVDYALFQHGQPIILIEAKKYGTTLKVEQESQLFRYFSATNARFGILTDGVVYRFYSDLDEPKEMDKKPFFEFNMLDFTDVQVERLKQFCKDSFNVVETVEAARELKYTNEVKRVLAEEMKGPCAEFVRFILDRIDYPSPKTKQRVGQFTPLVQQAFSQFVKDLIDARLKSALERGNEHLPQPTVEKDAKPATPQTLHLFMRFKGVQAEARLDDTGFVVLAGSQFVKEEQPSLRTVHSELRKAMLEDGRLVPEGSVYRLTQDHTFRSASGAAGAISGSRQSGTGIWRDSNGTQLGDLRDGAS